MPTKEYQRKWRVEHPEQVKEAKRKWRIENPEKTKGYCRNYQKKCREKNLEKLGSKCIFCGCPQSLNFHEIHGNYHNFNPNYVLAHIEDFTLLCINCHHSIHWCMKYLGLTWKDILGMKKW